MTAVEDYNDAMRENGELRDERDRLWDLLRLVLQRCGDNGGEIDGELVRKIAAELDDAAFVHEQGTMGAKDGR